jgi:predicted histidine transporter YuiF (NhaC family)
MYSNAIFTVACLCLNLACLFAYRKHKKQQQQPNGPSTNSMQKAEDKMEMKLVIYTIGTFLAQFIVVIYLVSLFLNLQNLIYSTFPGFDVFEPIYSHGSGIG